jgi:hypothetical protein
VEATTFNSNAWKRSSGSILEGNFIVYEESSWVQVNLSLIKYNGHFLTS